MAASAPKSAKKVPSCMFVCLGNICRSPTAEYVTRKLASDREMGIEVASSGTGNWHEGEGAHPPMVAAAKRKNYDLSAHVAQQVTAEHLKSYDYVLCMDSSNLSNLKRMFPAQSKALEDAGRLKLFCPLSGDLVSKGITDTPDPYYTDTYDEVVEIVELGATALLDMIAASSKTE